MEFIFHIFIMLNIYILLTLSANLTIGMANLLTMCQAAFYGIGAYIGTYFLMQFNLPFLIISALVMLLTGLFSILISFASVRLKGDYFVIATMGFQLIVYTILYNWTDVTRGPYGIPGISGIKLLGVYDIHEVFEIFGIYEFLKILRIQEVFPFFVFSSVITAIFVYLFRHLTKSPFGRVLNAIRADETMVESMGRNTVLFKSLAFFLSAAVSGLAGTIYASYIGYIDPTCFTLNESIFIISALFIGGIGNTKGPISGAVFVVLIPELLRFVGQNTPVVFLIIVFLIFMIIVYYYMKSFLSGDLNNYKRLFLGAIIMVMVPELLRFWGLPDSMTANLRQIIYGLALILVMYYCPHGLMGKNN
jgi:branched-chain amino acid transport system permease protein